MVDALRKDVPFANHHHLNKNHHHHRSQSHHHILSIRGGGGGFGREGAKNQSSSSVAASPPSLTLIGQTSIELAKYVWDYGSYTISNKVVPLAKDRILKPIRHILEDSPTKTTTTMAPPFREKFNNGEKEHHQQQQKDQEKTTATTTILATSSVSSQQRRRRRRNSDGNHSTSTTGDKKNKKNPMLNLKVLLLPKRIMKIGLTSWLLCEYLDFIGILNEETPVILKSQVDRVWYEEVRPRLSNIVSQLRLLAKQVMGRIVEVQLPIKYQFAIGTMTGMLASPLFPILAGLSVRSTMLLYGIAEAYSYYKSHKSSSSSTFILDYANVAFGPVRMVGRTIDNSLEHIRERVHRVFIEQQGNEYPLLTSRQAVVSCNGGKHDIYTKHQYSLSLTPDITTKATAASGKTSNCSSLRKSTTKDSIVLNGQRISNNGMISHGFLIGGALGLFFGV